MDCKKQPSINGYTHALLHHSVAARAKNSRRSVAGHISSAYAMLSTFEMSGLKDLITIIGSVWPPPALYQEGMVV